MATSAMLTGQAGLYRFLNRHAVALSLAMAGLVFIADIATPLGVASGVPYTLAILLTLNSSSRRYMVAFAILCSVLTISDLYIGPGRGGSELWKVLTNRTLALCMIWITLTLCMMRKRAEQRRREAEEQTRQHLADLAHMHRLKTAGQLAATLAHELNQPLAAISFQSEVAGRLVENNGHTDKLLLNALKEVTDQSHRAADIIRSLRKLVQKSTPQQSRVQINDIVRDVTTLSESRFENGGVDLQLQLGDIPEIMGDRIQLEQVLFNLLQNSLDSITEANNGTGCVLVDTERNGDDSVKLSVRDTGIGVGVENVEKVFDRFYSSKPKGMGMGLAISRSIIEAHGGRLWAEPHEDCGATFRLSLPEGN